MRLRCVGLALLLGCSACGSAAYRPLTARPQRVAAGEASVTQVVVRVPREDEVTVETRFEPGTRLLRAGRLTRKNACPAEPASLQTIDGRPRYELESPPLDGTHSLTLNVPVGSKVPLAIETERHGERSCSVVDAHWPDNWEREPFWYGEATVAFLNFDAGPYVIGSRFLLARWLGRARFSTELSLPSPVTCDDESSCNDAWGLPLTAEAAVSAHPSGGLFTVLGVRPLLFLRKPTGQSVRADALALEAHVQAVIGDAPRRADVAPLGGAWVFGVDVGPALALGDVDQRWDWVWGFQFGYGLTP